MTLYVNGTAARRCYIHVRKTSDSLSSVVKVDEFQ